MKSLSENDAIDVLRRLRAGESMSKIVSQVRDGNLLLQLSLVPETRRLYDPPKFTHIPDFLLTPENVYLSSAIYMTAGQSETSSQDPVYTIPFHAAEVVDPLIDQATAAPWTIVISDNKLLRRLLRGFFQHAYAEWFPFHKDLFLSDMVSGKGNFCSALLVNAILANACYTYRDLPDRAKYWLPDNLTYKFTAEAKRLWEIESLTTKSRITTIQALQILSIIMEYDATQVGKAFTVQCISMAHRFGLFQKSSNDVSHKMEKARTWTAWSQYAWQAMIRYSIFKQPYQREPPESSLPKDPSWYGEIYLQYPQKEKLIPMRLQHCVMAKCSLRALTNKIGIEAFSGDIDRDTTSRMKLSLDRTLHFKASLDAWFQALPEPLQPAHMIFPKEIGIQ